MNDKIIEFPRKKRREIHALEISECLNEIIDLTQSRGGILLLLKHDEDAAVAWSGELNTQDMIRLCSLGIYDAYTLEKQEEDEEDS
jgi:hypothetical protein